MSDTSSAPPTSDAPPRRGIVGRVRGLDPVVSVATVLLAAASYVPSFLTKPGIVADDAKQYLYLDPGKLMSSAISMWNPDVGMGTVTHQNIGFLFPMGPYYWIIQQLHIPMWVGQRFWMGSLFFFAGTGVFFLGRLLGLNRWGRIAAGVAYTFTPFVIDYIARISPIVMPWTALGWMVGLVILSVRKGGWKYPALFAIVIALVGGVNATSILLAGLAPALWLVYAVWITKEAPLRRALAAVLRLGVLSLGVSLWWAAGLWAEGVYGLNILKFTETIPTVTSTSLSSEVVRGLGYWYFYGQDKIQPWTSAAIGYMQSGWLIGVSFAVPALCALVGAFARWRYRAFAVGLLLIGVVAAVAAYPLDDPSPLGKALRAAGSDSTVGLAMRSTNRVIPLIVLGFALLLGAGISALAAVRFKTSLVVLALALAASVAQLPPLWNGTLVANNLARPEQLPGYVLATAKYLNSQGTGRVLGIPGEDFAYYRWGVTGDPVWPGLIDRPYVARQVVPQGEPGSVDLLQALDESMQDGVFNPSTLLPIARLMSATNILFQGNEQYERFNTARPQPLWLELLNPATGLGTPVSFGKPTIDKTTTFPLQDETQLAVPTGASVPPPEAVFTVKGARPLVRTETTSAPLVVAGSGAGLVNASAAGLLDGDPTIFYAASFAKDKKGLDQLLNNGAVLVLTDTNQKEQETWGSLDDNIGYVQQAKAGPLAVDPNEQSLPPVSTGGTAAQTVTTLSGVASVRASVYGNPITNTPEDQAYNAFDQNPDTRWAEGAFGPGTGAQLQVTLEHPVTAAQIRLLQPQTGPRNRWITRVSLTFDGTRTITRHLGPGSRKEPGQVVHFPTRTFKTLTLTVDATSSGVRKTYNGFSGVGFADVTIPGVAPVVQTLRLPTDLLSSVGATSISHPLVILLNRLRAASVPPRSDPEQNLNRSFSLPTARTFSIGGDARIAATDPDPVIDQLVGRTPVKVTEAEERKANGAEVVFSNSSGRLPGDLSAGAYAAIDGNAGTAWVPGFGPQDGNWVQYSFDRPVSFADLVLKVVTDGRHSIPTKITVSTGPESRTFTLSPLPDGKGRPQGSTTTLPLLFPTLTGQQVRITIEKTRPLKELDYYSNAKQTFPVGLAEIGLPGIDAPATPPTSSSGCLTNVLSIDGQPVDVQVTGSTASALAGDTMQISGCGNSAAGVTLGPGSHNLVTGTAAFSGLEFDTLWLSSASGGAALPLTAAGTIPTATAPSTPAATVVHQDRSHVDVRVAGTGSPYWLVLGQSQSAGWRASIQGGASLGGSTLIDGYANGWLVSGPADRGTRVFDLSWTPQKVVDAALLASGVTLAVSVGVVVVPNSWLAWAWVGTGRLVRRRWLPRRNRLRSDEPESSTDDAPADAVSTEEVAPVRASRRSRLMAMAAAVPRALPRRHRGESANTEKPSPETAQPVPTDENEADESVEPVRTSRQSRLLTMVAAVPRVLPRRHRGASEADTEVAVPETTQPAPPEEAAATDPADGAGPVLAGSGHDAPVLMSLYTSRGRRPHWLVLIVAALATGAVAGVISAPLAGPIVAGAVLIGCLVPWSRLVFVVAPFGLLAATGVYTVVEQDRHRYFSNIGWPEQFPIANTLTWMAVCALLAGAVVETARWRGWVAGDEFFVRYWKKRSPAGEPPAETTDVAPEAGEAPAPPVADVEPDQSVSDPGSETTPPKTASSDDGIEAIETTPTEAETTHERPGRRARFRSWLTAPLRWSRKRRTDTLSPQSEVPSGEQPSDHHP